MEKQADFKALVESLKAKSKQLSDAVKPTLKSVGETVKSTSKQIGETVKAKSKQIGEAVKAKSKQLNKAYQDLPLEQQRALLGGAVGAGAGVGLGTLRGKRRSIREIVLDALTGGAAGASIGYLSGKGKSDVAAQSKAYDDKIKAMNAAKAEYINKGIQSGLKEQVPQTLKNNEALGALVGDLQHRNIALQNEIDAGFAGYLGRKLKSVREGVGGTIEDLGKYIKPAKTDI